MSDVHRIEVKEDGAPDEVICPEYIGAWALPGGGVASELPVAPGTSERQPVAYPHLLWRALDR